MLLEIYDIEPLKNFFDVIYDSASVVEMKLDSEKLLISLLNNSHIAFYNLEISKLFFGDYEIDGVENVLIFVEDFYKILKSANKNDTLYLETNDSYLICKFENETNHRIFELPLAEEYGESPMPPSIEYDGVFNVSLDDLKQAVNDLSKIVKTDRFKMILNDATLNITAPSDVMTNYSNEIDLDTSVNGYVTVNIDYISQILKLSKINKNVDLKVGDGIPLSWNMSSTDELVNISGLIAPIIEIDE